MITRNPALPAVARLPDHPAQTVDRSRVVSFQFEGRVIAGYAGEPIAAALYASGQRLFSRSFKYHRPRGLLCVAGRCPNCLMNVDGVPNVRTCVTPVTAGCRVRPQNAWPSLANDALAVLDRFDRFLPAGFYYKTFMRPRELWPTYERVIRHMAGIGVVDITADLINDYEKETRHVDVLVIGGGPAGISAARAAAAAGLEVLLVDDQPALGGHLRVIGSPVTDAGEFAGQNGYEIARQLAASLTAPSSPDVTVLLNAAAFGCYEGHLIAVMQGKRCVQVRAQQVVMTTGAFERPAVFPDNDLPGIFLGSGLQRLINLYRIAPGRAAVVATTGEEGYAVAADLVEAGVRIAALVDARPNAALPERLRAGVTNLIPNAVVCGAWGRGALEGVRVRSLDGGAERAIDADLLALSVGMDPAGALLAQAGARMSYDEAVGAFLPETLPAGVLAAGAVTGVRGLAALLADGARAGHEAARRINPALPPALAPPERGTLSSTPALLPAPPGGHKAFVCLCEDVSTKDIASAVGEGFDGSETIKRYTTVGMGVCQGKMCATAAAGLCARETGRSIADTGTTTRRPPAQPVPLGALAARLALPVKRTALHHRHVALGARMMNLGDWKRPEYYTSVDDEVRAVCESVGIIDVGTLGKLEVRGRDAVRLLERVYTNRFGDLAVGRVRYGVVCDESGIILDDGTFCRLAEDHFFLTTTSGGTEAMEEWLKSWSVPSAPGQEIDAYVTNVTAGLCAVNVAGPRAREVVQPLTDLDLSPSAFRYLAAGNGVVAGVPALLLRIGFVGELGYEIHYPAEYGEHVWDALMESGARFGIRPFGVEAQRILRLQKQHIIVTHDTDALSTPVEANMAWIVKLEKEEFVGRPALERYQRRGPRQQLVGFRAANPHRVPPEGASVVRNGQGVGRVTSAKYSPVLHQVIGLAWMPAEMAKAGAEFHIAHDHTLSVATVVTEPFYDPAGERLRA